MKLKTLREDEKSNFCGYKNIVNTDKIIYNYYNTGRIWLITE